MYSKIINPKTGRKVKVTGVLGRKILQNYLNYLNGGVAVHTIEIVIIVDFAVKYKQETAVNIAKGISKDEYIQNVLESTKNRIH